MPYIVLVWKKFCPATVWPEVQPMLTPQEFYSWLIQRIHDGGKNALTEIATFARDETELFMKGPAMAAMLCWKERGIEEIVEISTAHPTSKNLSSAYKLLSATAAGGRVDPNLLFIHNSALEALVQKAIADESLRQVARTYLADLMQALDPFDLLIPLGVAFTQLGMISDHGAQELIRAMSARWLRVGPRIIKEYLDLLSDHPNEEKPFQQFFCNHPQILDPMAKQIWSQPDFHGAHQPDFVIRRADNSYVIIEIETPGKQVVTQAAQLSADATHAEKQAADYREFLNERIKETRDHFPKYSSAECLAIIGLEAPLNQLQVRALANVNAGRHNVRIAGFDWLAFRAQAIIENISAGELEVIQGHRII